MGLDQHGSGGRPRQRPGHRTPVTRGPTSGSYRRPPRSLPYRVREVDSEGNRPWTVRDSHACARRDPVHCGRPRGRPSSALLVVVVIGVAGADTAPTALPRPRRLVGRVLPVRSGTATVARRVTRGPGDLLWGPARGRGEFSPPPSPPLPPPPEQAKPSPGTPISARVNTDEAPENGVEAAASRIPPLPELPTLHALK
jgi:hypothetical protein